MFLRNNWKPLLLVTFVIISEVTVKAFKSEHSIINNYAHTWGDILYYLFAQVGYISFLPSLFLFKLTINKESQGIYLGLVVWNVYEVIQELNTVFKLNISFLDKAHWMQGDVLQIIFIIFTVILMYHGHKKCHT